MSNRDRTFGFLLRDGPRPWRRIHLWTFLLVQVTCISLAAMAKLTDWLDDLHWLAGLSLLVVPLGTICGWSILAERQLRRRVRSREGAVCTACAYDLSHSGAKGVCPECGEPFALAQVREQWQRAGLLPPDE